VGLFVVNSYVVYVVYVVGIVNAAALIEDAT
jgi:hypothetical protein